MEAMPEDMWSPYKHLYKVIEQAISAPSASTLAELEMCLKKCKHKFSMILRNPPKNERSRQQLRNGLSEGITITGQNRQLLISKDLVDECIIISDMYDLDEFVALDLLCTAQRQMPKHPGLPRGLVAILLYYDGRKALTYALRDLFQVTQGSCWVTNVPKEVTYLISSFTHSLVDESNVLGRIVDLLEELDFATETVLLTKNRAFGDTKHQNQVSELFENIRLGLATALFNWSAQRGLPKLIVTKLLQILPNFLPTEASGAIDDVTTTMTIALLYSFDACVSQQQETNNSLMQGASAVEPDFLQQIFDIVATNNTWSNKNQLGSFIKFAFGLSLASFRHGSQNLQSSLSKMIEQDEQLIDDALSNKLFELIYYQILEKDIIFKTEFFYRRIHMLFTDFIDFMHSKVTELRGRADETAKTMMSFKNEGLEPPSNLDHNFEMLMLCIGKFYKDNRAGLSLCIEYWGPMETSTDIKANNRSVSLFKFIRLAGELLPSSLFVPYLKMIAGLTSCERSARNAFNLLKQSSGLSGSTTLSWEHFFASLTQYYSNLRQEYYPGTDTIYRSRGLNRTINPQEIDGIHAVLCIIEAVCSYDEISRTSICEHPNWAPLHVLIGLLTCPVPLSVKADILRTLSAFAKSKQTAISLWNTLEASQIIPTIPTANNYSGCNLETEIEQNECRVETYPLSTAILDMFYSLISTILPTNLGAGTRTPGIDAYISFIIKGIFLKFYNRGYKDYNEKWEIGEKCLKIIHFLLQTYEINVKDFRENSDEPTAPGFQIMLQLHTKSEMLRYLLLLLDEAQIKLSEYCKFRGKEKLEECSLHALKIIEIGLARQDAFFNYHSLINSSILLSGLNKLLLDINPRSGFPDHVLNTTKFVVYYSWLPSHAMAAIKILNMVSRVSNVSSQILDIFTQSNNIQYEIRQGFVESLENEILLLPSSDESAENSQNPFKIELLIKEAIIEFLQNCLIQPGPNIAYFFLGLDVIKDAYANERQRTNIIDSSSNCIKSLIASLDSHLELQKVSNVYDEGLAKITERSYYFLFSLCENQRISDTILRYLRYRNDFLCRHLSALPFKNTERYYVLNQMSHLLKCAAIELKTTASNCQISRFQHLCELLIGTDGKLKSANAAVELNHYYTHSVSAFAEEMFSVNPSDKSSSNTLLCRLLDCLNFQQESQNIPKWDYYDNSLIQQILKECEVKTADGFKIINLKKLHNTLNTELNTLQNTIANGQRKLIQEEIESILIFALKLNEDMSKNFATIKLMRAWGQVTEILFTCSPESALPVSIKQELILEILQKLLSKVVPDRPSFELSILASNTILILLVNLRYYNLKKPENARSDTETSNIFPTALKSRNGNDLFSKSNSLNLKFILKNILDWIIMSEVSSQKLRINLYSALLNCLYILKGNHAEEYKYGAENFDLSRLRNKVEAIDEDESNRIRMFTEVLLSCGDKLIDIICHDCISGQDICKMSALGCVNVLINLDRMSSVLNFIANRGYLSHIIDSLLKSDESLCCILRSIPTDMNALFVYESKMAMLLRFASTQMGAEILLSNKILNILSTMRIFDMRPDIQSTIPPRNTFENFIPPIDDRFRDILFPALSFCESMISTLGVENHSVVAQIANFLASHGDTIEMILRNGTPFADLGLLKEMSKITGLIARIMNQEIFVLNKSNEPVQELCVNLDRIQRLMFFSFPRFIISETILKELLKAEDTLHESSESNKDQRIQYFLEIAMNLSLYCRNAIANHSADHRANRILFSSIFDDRVLRTDNRNPNATQSLDNVVNQLKGSVEYLCSQKSVTERLMRQNYSSQAINFNNTINNTSTDLTKRYNQKQNELAVCAFIADQCLYILWTHLDFFMRRSAPSLIGGGRPLIQDIIQDSAISQENLNALKKNLIATFNETFCKKLLSTCSTNARMEIEFRESLLRRIKSLLQFSSPN